MRSMNSMIDWIILWKDATREATLSTEIDWPTILSEPNVCVTESVIEAKDVAILSYTLT